MFPALANLSKGLAGSLGVRGMGEAQGTGEAPLAMVAGAMGCPMVVGTVDSVEASTRPLSSVVRGSSTHSFFSGSLEVVKLTILCYLMVVCLLSTQV